MITRRAALAGAGLTGAFFLFSTTDKATAHTISDYQATLSEDQQFELILRKLESLPRHLKLANPTTYPGYENEIRHYLGEISLVTPVESKFSNPNNWACVASLAGFVASTAIPVFKIISWIRRARAIWGGVRGIITAIRSGAAAREIGGEAATVLGEILGIGGVAENCFNKPL